MQFCSGAKVGKKKLHLQRRKLKCSHKLSVTLYIDICADRILNILLNLLY